MRYLPPKGTQDLYNTKYYEYEYIAQTILSTLECYGFRQVRTPGFEPIDILAKDAGSEITEQIYTFKDKGGREFGIKSDITPSVTRFIAGNSKSMAKPIKISCYDRIYRYERPQTGRYREITQVNAEMYGVSSPLSDVELIACFYQCYVQLGLPQVVIEIGFRPILVGYIKFLGVEDSKLEPLIRLVDKREKLSEKRYDKELLTLGISEDRTKKLKRFIGNPENPKMALKRLKKYVNRDKKLEKYLKWLNNVVSSLDQYEIIDKCQINLGLARGSDYYTGVIFEAKANNIPFSLGGAGRYDKLVAKYGGDDIPAVGFSIGIDRVYFTLEKLGLLKAIPKPMVDYYLISNGNRDSTAKTIKTAQNLRRLGKKVEIDLMSRTASKQKLSASKMKAGKVIAFDSSSNTNRLQS